jgi:hypothetical protein
LLVVLVVLLYLIGGAVAIIGLSGQ